MKRIIKSLFLRGCLMMSLLCGVSISLQAATSDLISSVTYEGTSGGKSTFKIVRSNSSAATIVNYRTQDGSAVGGIHFTHQAGRLYFKKGESSKTIQIDEFSAKQDIYAYGNNGDREYFLTAWNSFSDPITVSKSISNTKSYKSHNKKERTKFLATNFWWNDDKEVWQRFRLSEMVTADEEAYRKATGQDEWWYRFYFKFNVVHKDYGWFNTWIYMDGAQVHHFEYEDAWTASHREPANNDLWEKANNNRQVSIKWFSHGADDDYAKVNDLNVYCEYRDAQAPSVKALNCNTQYAYGEGDVLYVAVCFDEIVNFSQAQDNYKINTNVGDMQYVSGAGTNVLCFKTTLSGNSVIKGLKVTGANFKVADVAGNVQSSLSISNNNFIFKGGYTATFSVEPDMWKRLNKLSWSNLNTKSVDGLWHIYRYKTAEGPTFESDYSYPILNSEVSNEKTSFEDKSDTLLYDTDYTYLLQFVPKSLDTKTLLLDHFITKESNVQRKFQIVLQRTNFDDHIDLNWSSDEFKDSKTHEFKVFRRMGRNGLFEEIGKTNSSTKHYTDNGVSSGCATYYYKVSTASLFADDLIPTGVEYFSDSVSGQLTSESQVLSLEATKGDFANTVKLTWNTKQTGIDPTNFSVYRRDLNSNDGWVKIYSTSGTVTVYSYEDNTALPGKYYEYKVASSYLCAETGLETDPVEVKDDGFCRALGIISGRVTYGTGTAVDSVKVMVNRSSSDENIEQFYSLRVNGAGSGVNMSVSKKQGATYFEKPWTIQMYVNPDAKMVDEAGKLVTNATLVSLYDNFGLSLSAIDDNEYNLCVNGYVKGVWTSQKSALKINANEFSHVTLSYDGGQKMTIRLTDAYGEIQRASLSLDSLKFKAQNDSVETNLLAFGYSLTGTNTFHGYLDEMRLFADKELSDGEILKTYNHTLSGTESKLVMYWPMDEGINDQKSAYDYSKTSGVTNNNHGVILPGSSMSSKVIPTDDQLSVFGISDEMGNYTINGIPFSGDGTAYMVTPVYGIHKFSPQYATRFVSASSLVHSGVDFEDVSSFPANGVVYYYNTMCPVSGAKIYVDGIICSKNGEAIVSDVNGAFTISVPIGQHHIEVRKDNHVFVNAGRFPSNPLEEGLFDREPDGEFRFYDSTFVTLTGRVAGGFPESEKVHGLGVGKATIGKATIVLQPGGSAQLNLANEVRNYSCPSSMVRSSAYTGVGQEHPSRIVTIHTDSLTGEFAVSLPPIDFKVISVSVDNDSSISFPVDNIEMVALESGNYQVNSDTIVGEKNDTISFDYLYALDLIYRSKPNLEVTPSSNNNGVFGDTVYVYSDPASMVKDTFLLYSKEKDSISYLFNYPLFTQAQEYSFMLYGYESYVNRDGSTPVVTKIPLSGAEISVSNDLGATKVAIADVVDDDSISYSTGDIVDSNNQGLSLDDDGKAEYSFLASYPNIVAPYTLGMNISYTYAGKSYQWDQNGLFKGIVVGGLPTGNNFVTGGPDLVTFILRDPPGTGSSAFLEEGTTITNSHYKSKGFNSENSIKTTSYLGITNRTAGGTPCFMVLTDIKSDNDLIVGTDIKGSYTKGKTFTTTTTTTQRISTSDAMNYVGADGDVFIGTGTNYVFGKQRMVAPVRAADSSYSISLEEAIGVKQSFSTCFKYTQNYIENVLIPNYEMLRNASFICGVPEAMYNDSYPNNTGAPIYITRLSAGDERLGSRNTDKSIWADAASSKEDAGPSYIMIMPDDQQTKADTIVWYNTQIEKWINYLKMNEEAKVKAIESGAPLVNHSFDSGSSIEYSVETCNDSTTNTNSHAEVYLKVGWNFGVKLNGFGVGVEIETNDGYVQDWGKDSSFTKCTTVGYSLVEDGDDDALTVDVFKASDGFGPIFYTRAGQTTCPYEDVKTTKYYKPGTVIAEKTMQIEYPRIMVENPYATDVPSGSAANFTLKLDNLSETSEDVWYMMYVVDESNPNGAALSIDGVPFSTSRQVLVNALETTSKNLQIKQSRYDIMKYDSIAVVLASNCQYDGTDIFEVIADTVYLSVEFVPSCSPITLQIDDRTMNTSTGDTLQLVVKDFEKDYLNFNEIRIQYKGERDNDWNLANKIMVDEIEGARQVVNFPMSSVLFTDQTYQFRAQSVCSKGASDIITNESEIIPLVKDMARPQVLGNPNPSDGILNAGDEISVTFNEDIRNSMLSKADNFIVQAVLNDAEVDHKVALKFENPSQYIAATESDIVLGNKDFAVDMWVYLTSGGTLLRHVSKKESFTMGVSSTGQMVLNVNGKSVTSKNAIPLNKWCFVTLSFVAGEDSSAASALVAYDAETLPLLVDVQMPNYGATAPLKVGANIRGAMSELALWSGKRTNAESQSQMHFAKAASTENLIGYWKFDEGHGTVAKDMARNRHMALVADSWYLNNSNYAAAFDGTSQLALNISNSVALDGDDYMVETWFQGKHQTNATLWSANTQVALKFNAQGNLTLLTDSVETQLTSNDYLDGVWHHVALNVLRNGVTSVYVDGNLVKQLASSKVPALQASELTLGAQRYRVSPAVYGYKDHFVGNMDEVRYWVATFNAKAIDQFRYMRLQGDEAGLAAYYPFEGKKVDAGQTSNIFSLSDASIHAMGSAAGVATQAVSAPALRQKPEMSDLNYSFVASERTVVINLNESASRLEGTTVNFTLKNVRDENNNYSLPVTWSAFINQNRLVWSDDEIALEKGDEEKVGFDLSVVNQSGASQSWAISQLPTWLTLSKNNGSLDAQKSENIHFEISDAVPAGTYEEVVYLSGNEGINVPLTIRLKVVVGKPDWSVDPSLYENSMSIIAQLKINGAFSDDTEDMVAAFINGECVGVASPVYYPRYDAYFVSLDVYGNSASSRKAITFKAWDASTGIIYPSLTPSVAQTFSANKLSGSMTLPVILESNSMQEQPMDLNAGWNWISLNVIPFDNSINGTFGDIAADANVLKSKTTFTTSDGSSFSGSLKLAKVGLMYKLNMNDAASFSVVGSSIDATNQTVTVAPGWNWIGFNSTVNMTLNDAFAGLNPVEGDMVKSQTGFALYQGYEWVGTLTALNPGKGYMYKSLSNVTRTFSYPAKTASLRSLVAKNVAPATAYSPISETTYSGNMTIVAKVKDGADVLENVQVGIFDTKGVCRAATTLDENHFAYLTILGETTGDSLLIKVLYNGFEYVLNQDLTYAEDGMLGSLSDPYIIQINPVNGVVAVKNSSISIYPTLVETTMDVVCESDEVLNYSIIDLAGRLIDYAEVNSDEFTINASSLSAGTYVLQLETASGLKIKRFTKK